MPCDLVPFDSNDNRVSTSYQLYSAPESEQWELGYPQLVTLLYMYQAEPSNKHLQGIRYPRANQNHLCNTQKQLCEHPAPLLQHKLDSLDESPFDLEAPANEALLPKLSSTSRMDPTSVLKPSRGKGAFDPLLRSMSSSQNWSSHSTCRASLTSSPVLQTQNIEPSTPHHHNILLRHSFHGKKASWESYMK